MSNEQTEPGVEVEASGKVEAAVQVFDYQPSAGMDVESLMKIAIEKDGAIDVIKELVKLRNDEMDRQAVEALEFAMSEFKKLCPPIPRTQRGAKLASKDGSIRHLMYAPLDGIQKIIDPFCRQLGLRYAWNNRVADSDVITACVVTHVKGAKTRSEMALPVSTPPKANVTQGRSGTRSFNKRITLSDVFGIATMDDGDGAEEDHAPINADQLREMQQAVQKKDVNLDRFLALFDVASLKDIPTASFDTAMRLISSKPDKP